ncbi:acetoacetate decarboxylase [beta proteobacterium AAP99]|nr:acetoacetate decarboxylase [beta proteobacterium AAP99]
MTQRPPYLYPKGSVLMHPPLALNQADMIGCWVPGSLAALQASVDATLNQATQGKMQFKVMSSYVMLTFTAIAKAHSDFPVDRAKGWGKETDIITWVVVGQVLAGSTEASHVYFYPMHIWVDDCMALINGRELYGYPKYECQYTMPAPGQPVQQLTLAAKGFEPFSPDTQLTFHPLLDVNVSANGQSDTPLAAFGEAFREIIDLMKSEPASLHLGEAAYAQFADMLFHPAMDQIFLKQFPDAAGERAVYQAVVAAHTPVNAIRSVKMLGGQWQVNLYAFDSFPLSESLGLKIGVQDAILPFRVEYDFAVQPGQELVDNSVVKPEKIAVLGGGVGAMTAAFCLSNEPGWQNRYEITVYQMGWRLGGKGASGRNPKLGQRIEEHGLHIWFGFYDNAFKVMQRAYRELNRPAGSPLAAWTDAFKPQQFITLTENVDGQWRLWPINTPLRPGVPGNHSERLTLWAAIQTGIAWLKMWLGELHTAHAAARAAARPAPASNASWLEKLAAHLRADIEDLRADLHEVGGAVEALVQSLELNIEDHDPATHGLLADAALGIRAWINELLEDEIAGTKDFGDDLRRLYICIDLATTTLAGMVKDHVFTEGFEAINDIDFYQWLIKHGANRKYTVYSAPVRGFYDLVFAYEDGDFDKPNIEAGTMLRGMMKVAMCYHGGIMFKMQAGMGDVVFGPLYEVLKARGVKFKFFHKLTDLQPGTDAHGQHTVDGITLQQQVALVPGRTEYDPLVDVLGLPSWPSTPQYGQIEQQQAALLQAHNINLESNWSDWPEVWYAASGQPLPSVQLTRGTDFDRVVFGLSVASLPDVAAKLFPISAGLAQCAAQVKAVATQAYQVWLSQDIAGLGWTLLNRDGQEPVLSSFVEPFDTWAPMDQLLCRESWPSSQAPKNVSYFCSALPMSQYAPYSDSGFPARCANQVKQSAINQLNTEIGALWPLALPRSGQFRFDWLTDPQGGNGQERFNSQYWRANIDPSERYVISVVNSSQYRLKADQTGFVNMVIAGDWLKTGLDAGCVEAAVMGGMQASRALSGYPAVIHGEEGF